MVTKKGANLRKRVVEFIILFRKSDENIISVLFHSGSQTWVGYISQKIYIPEYIRFVDIFTGYNIIVKIGYIKGIFWV